LIAFGVLATASFIHRINNLNLPHNDNAAAIHGNAEGN